MQAIRVSLGAKSYNTYIGAGVLRGLVMHLRRAKLSNRIVLITNPTVYELYGITLREALLNNGFDVNVFYVPDGEEYKSLESAGRLLTEMSEALIGRNATVLALGGGVIGDLAGFVAATYMRGIQLIQLPTTLLAQVDSSIGGKTAVNHGKLKNQIGVFYQPIAVFSDTSVLKTLPDRHISNGLAEVIKSAVIGDRTLFGILARHMPELLEGDERLLQTVIQRAASVKARIVSRDEHDNGMRNTLNFGHTIGHAIESVSSFNVNHGAAVAVGMVMAGRIALQTGLFSQHDLDGLMRVIASAGLPTSMPEINPADILKAMRHDKKAVNGLVKFILPVRIGQVIITNRITFDMVAEALTE